MRNILFICMLLISWPAFSQVNQTDANGLRQGKWEKQYPDGKLMYEGQFRDGKPVGEWTRYHPGGNVKARIRYSANSDTAFVQLFNEQGHKIAKGSYLNEKRSGTWTFFHNGVQVAEEEYVNDKKHGVSRNFYPSGEIFDQSEWQQGVQEGKYEAFYKDGSPYMQCKFSNGKRNGLCLTRFQNGRVEMEAYYVNDLRDGKWVFYNPEGDSLYSLRYQKGRCLNPEVRDSVDNLRIQDLERGKHSLTDPEKFMQNPTDYMMQMDKFR